MKTVFNQENTLYKENQDEIKQKINKYFLKNINIFNKYINPKKKKNVQYADLKILLNS